LDAIDTGIARRGSAATANDSATLKVPALVGTAPGRRSAPEARIDRLPPLKARVYGVPVFDRRLTHPPAKQNHFIFNATGKVEQAGIEILHLDADRVNFGDALANLPQMFFHCGALPGDLRGIHPHSAREIDLLGQTVQFGLDGLGGTPALDGSLEQGLEHWEQGLRFVECEGFHSPGPLSIQEYDEREAVII
jgi:hypothetical protein